MPVINGETNSDKNFKENIDAWIKCINAEFSQIKDLSTIINENENNIQYNYELICDLKEELTKIKLELQSMKLIQLICFRDNLNKKT